MINEKISVVTVTFNNKYGLQKTLNSLCMCNTKPCEIIVIDGGSKDGTLDVISDYEGRLPLKFISEPDDGIYNAMNKGLKNVKTPLVHYLNSGDFAYGDLYLNCSKPTLLSVKIYEPASGVSWYDQVKLSGYGYCHQGIIFPSNHFPFNESLKIAADFEVICKTFINGLHVLPLCDTGYVVYELGGISSIKSDVGNREIIAIANNLLNRWSYLRIYFYVKLKDFLPRSLRRFFAKISMKGS